jgi:hypothetical protein
MYRPMLRIKLRMSLASRFEFRSSALQKEGAGQPAPSSKYRRRGMVRAAGDF